MDNQNQSYLEPAEIKLKGVSQLLKESWGIYRARAKVLLGIMVIPFGFSFLGFSLVSLLSKSPISYSVWFFVIWVTIYLVSIFLNWLAISTLICSIKENTGLKESYKRGLKIFTSFLLVTIFLNLIIAGGFLLLIIPGILFSIWFSLAAFVLIFEEEKGMNALFKSKHLVSGRFWGILWRFLGFGLIITIVIVIISATLVLIFSFAGINEQRIEQMGNAFGYLVLLFFSPLALIYGNLIYKNLKDIKKETPYQELPPTTRLKYFLPGILGLLIWGVVFGFNFLSIFGGRDEPPYDDSDLWLTKVEISREDNAYFPLIKAEEKLYWPDEKKDIVQEILDGKSWDDEIVKEFLIENEETFYYLDKALNLSILQIPDFQDPEKIDFGTVIPPLSNWRKIARLNSLRALYLFKQGTEEESLNEAVKTVRLGQMVGNSPRPSLIQYLVSIAIKRTGLETISTITKDTTLSPKLLKFYIKELDSLKSDKEGLITTLKMEYIWIKNEKEKIDAGLVSKEELKELTLAYPTLERTIKHSNYFYKPNQTTRIFAEHYRREINNFEKDYCNEMEDYEIKLLAPNSSIKRMFTENIVGKIIHDISVISFSGISDRRCEEDFWIIGSQVLLAMKAYQAETGKLPNSLIDLVPEYFAEIPRDPFDEKPIRYSPEKKIIYSVGEDLIDSDGSEGESWEAMLDPTFKIEF